MVIDFDNENQYVTWWEIDGCLLLTGRQGKTYSSEQPTTTRSLCLYVKPYTRSVCVPSSNEMIRKQDEVASEQIPDR